MRLYACGLNRQEPKEAKDRNDAFRVLGCTDCADRLGCMGGPRHVGLPRVYARGMKLPKPILPEVKPTKTKPQESVNKPRLPPELSITPELRAKIKADVKAEATIRTIVRTHFDDIAAMLEKGMEWRKIARSFHVTRHISMRLAFKAIINGEAKRETAKASYRGLTDIITANFDSIAERRSRGEYWRVIIASINGMEKFTLHSVKDTFSKVKRRQRKTCAQ